MSWREGGYARLKGEKKGPRKDLDVSQHLGSESSGNCRSKGIRMGNDDRFECRRNVPVF